MTAGRLAARKPLATTNTLLYRCPITSTASTVLSACNHEASATITYKAALRNYDQVLHLDGPETYNGGPSVSPYLLKKGNPISAYRVILNPGYQFNQIVPGAIVPQTTNGSKFKILDVFRPTADVVYYTQVKTYTQVGTASISGTFAGGETVTGATSGFTAIMRGQSATGLELQIANLTATATGIQISRTTGLNTGYLLTFNQTTPGDGGEIATISTITTATNSLVVTRGSLGTTAATIAGGRLSTVYSASSTTSTISEGAPFTSTDVTLTVASSSGFVSGSFIRIGNEILEISAVNGNDLTVTRARFGTAAINHNDTSTVTLLTNNGNYLINYYSEGETVSGATSNASAVLSFTTTTNVGLTTAYIVSTTSAGATDHIRIGAFTFNPGRNYKFDLSDASCTNYPLKFSTTGEGTNALIPGIEYTQGVSKVGTAGTAGAFTSIAVETNTTPNLNVYADGTPAGSTLNVGFTALVDTNPFFTDIFIYDIDGQSIMAGDTFTLNAITQTVQQNGVYPGPYGYVQSYDSAKAHLKVSIDKNSTEFTTNTEFYDTPTLNNSFRTIAKVVTGKILSVTGASTDIGRVVGTYGSTSGLVANSTNGPGNISKARFKVVVTSGGVTTVTILNGGENFVAGNTVTINDSQLGNGGAAALVLTVGTISTGVHTDTTSIYSDEDYIAFNKSVAGTNTDKISGLVVGPGESVLINSSSVNSSFQLNGFETESGDYIVINMVKD